MHDAFIMIFEKKILISYQKLKIKMSRDTFFLKVYFCMLAHMSFIIYQLAKIDLKNPKHISKRYGL
jgi:uncharacterized membrane protein